MKIPDDHALTTRKYAPPVKGDDHLFPPDDPQGATKAMIDAQLLTFSQLNELPRAQYIVKNLMADGDVGLVYGVSMAGKSFLALDLLWSIANGQDWFGYRIKEKRQVVYFALEGKGGIVKRMAALEQRHGKATLDNFLFMVQTLDLTDDRQIQAWTEAIKAKGIARPVIAIDTVAQASTGIDENASAGMGLIISGAQRLAQLVGGTVILIHHAGKDTSRGARGWSGLKGAMDFQIEVSVDEKTSARSWKAEKVKDDESGQQFQFALEVVTLSVDEDGDDVTSCLIKQTTAYQSDKPTDKQIQDQVLRFITSKVEAVSYPSKTSIRDELVKAGITQRAQASAIAVLISELRLEERDMPRESGSKGGKTKYLHPI